MLDIIRMGTEGRTILYLCLQFTSHMSNACVFLMRTPYGHGRARKGATKATKITEVELLCYDKWVQMLGFCPLEISLMIKAYKVMKAADELKIILNPYHIRKAHPETNSGSHWYEPCSWATRWSYSAVKPVRMKRKLDFHFDYYNISEI